MALCVHARSYYLPDHMIQFSWCGSGERPSFYPPDWVPSLHYSSEIQKDLVGFGRSPAVPNRSYDKCTISHVSLKTNPRCRRSHLSFNKVTVAKFAKQQTPVDRLTGGRKDGRTEGGHSTCLLEAKRPHGLAVVVAASLG
ncbi:uncharacterized protein UTRI_06107 [Ustilago trichophora]|uniref:Uncharacterized protein n=1 Tax=Ustilago trichophora TaxID=86804 RepID=A0A5C3EF98_9BASI|nr:uncharacterized protein UTRI_06107 [Ustilago trichophora]